MIDSKFDEKNFMFFEKTSTHIRTFDVNFEKTKYASIIIFNIEWREKLIRASEQITTNACSIIHWILNKNNKRFRMIWKKKIFCRDEKETIFRSNCDVWIIVLENVSFLRMTRAHCRACRVFWSMRSRNRFFNIVSCCRVIFVFFII